MCVVDACDDLGRGSFAGDRYPAESISLESYFECPRCGKELCAEGCSAGRDHNADEQVAGRVEQEQRFHPLALVDPLRLIRPMLGGRDYDPSRSARRALGPRLSTRYGVASLAWRSFFEKENRLRRLA
jgi:hypothetical protein